MSIVLLIFVIILIYYKLKRRLKLTPPPPPHLVPVHGSVDSLVRLCAIFSTINLFSNDLFNMLLQEDPGSANYAY